MRRLAAGVGAVAAFLDFDAPTVPAALRHAATGDAATGGDAEVADGHGVAAVTVVPALLTRAYHGRVDLPRVLAEAGVPARLTPVLGPTEPGEHPHPLLLAALRRRLSEMEMNTDGVVLVAAGTTDPRARSTVEHVAARLGQSLRIPCVAGFVSPSGEGFTIGEAVDALRDAGARQPLAASYFLAPGRLHDAAGVAARAAGAIGVAQPLAGTAELAGLVRWRISAATAETERGPAGANGSPLTPVGPGSIC